MNKNKYRNIRGMNKILDPDIKTFQYLLYKDKDIFIDTIIKLPERNTFKTSLVTKLKEAITNKLPTVALEFFKKSKYYDQEVLDLNLQETLELCNLPNEEDFMRSAFRDIEIPQLGEYYYYLRKIDKDMNDIVDLIFERFGDHTVTKYSDFLNLGMVLTNPNLFNRELKEHLDTFFDRVIYKYLMVYVTDIKSTRIFPNTFEKDFIKRYEYFSEGNNIWNFLDNDLKNKILKEDVRRLSANEEYKYLTTKSYKTMLVKLEELYEYISFCYFRLDSNKYKFAVY